MMRRIAVAMTDNTELIDMDTDLIDKLARAIAANLPAHIPIDVALWSAADCAAYLRISESSFYQRVAPLPGFPQAIRIPRADGHKGHPRWKAREVIEWAEQYQERRAA